MWFFTSRTSESSTSMLICVSGLPTHRLQDGRKKCIVWYGSVWVWSKNDRYQSPPTSSPSWFVWQKSCVSTGAFMRRTTACRNCSRVDTWSGYCSCWRTDRKSRPRSYPVDCGFILRAQWGRKHRDICNPRYLGYRVDRLFSVWDSGKKTYQKGIKNLHKKRRFFDRDTILHLWLRLYLRALEEAQEKHQC